MPEEDIRITIIDRDGISHAIDAPTDMGMSLMEICKAYDLPVLGTCGGMALCATCQVYIESNHNLPEKSFDEEIMLDEAHHVQENSRLGCQIPMTPDLKGLKVRLAPDA